MMIIPHAIEFSNICYEKAGQQAARPGWYWMKQEGSSTNSVHKYIITNSIGIKHRLREREERWLVNGKEQGKGLGFGAW